MHTPSFYWCPLTCYYFIIIISKKFNGVHYISNNIGREGVATLTLIVSPVGEEGSFDGDGEVWKTTVVNIVD